MHLAIHHTFHPRPPLSAFIKSFWYYQGERPAHTRERRLPDGSVALIINLHDDLTRIYDPHNPDQFQDYCGSVISGAHSAFTLIDTLSLTSVIGVDFKPGGAWPFLPLPASELHNQVVSLEIIWGQEAHSLRERLLAAATPQRQFSLLEQFLLSRLIGTREAHPAITFATQALHDVSSGQTISSIIEQIGIGQTRFLQVFREAVGLTPKQFYRVLRFQEALRRLEQESPERLSRLAMDCGYYDQAHFIHDFQDFSGLTPRSYQAQRSEYRNHIILPN
ncbi:AraC family transcriptional regulator [Ktedonobacter racemifer]|uniref:AraC family transcriptional regulator n=1 Tax=Ktedonobacter racemifer TaxID=363277 RepID=UPI0002DEB150|nr:helix-turn-helix domain-containing protein [Ktedonobacter racemifer]